MRAAETSRRHDESGRGKLADGGFCLGKYVRLERDRCLAGSDVQTRSLQYRHRRSMPVEST